MRDDWFPWALIGLFAAVSVALLGFAAWSVANPLPCIEWKTERQTVCVDGRGDYCGAYAERDVRTCVVYGEREP